MKKIKHIIAIAIFLVGTMLLTNCQNNDFEELVQEEQFLGKKKPDKFIYYRGLKVKKRFKASEKELKVKKDKKSLKALYNRLRKEARKKPKLLGKGLTTDVNIDDEPLENEELPSPEVVVEAIKVVFSSFPYEEIEDFVVINRPNKDFVDEEMIRDDFPDLTDAEIVVNESIIDDYYSENLDYMVLEEIANNPTVYDNIGTLQQKSASNNFNDAERALCLIIEAMDSPNYYFGFVRSAFSVFLAGKNSRESLVDSGGYFEFADESDSRRDAYRHMLWNSLLAQYYFTISSKSKRLSFAETVANANEGGMCGSPNNVDTREMDFHNNVIGRKIWNDNTGYRTIFGATIGLNRTSTSHLKGLALDKIEKEGLFIIKTYHGNSSFNYNDIETQALILQTDIDTPVYFVGPIAPVYETSIEQEFYDCNETPIAPKQKDKEIILLGKAPIEDEEEGDCVRNVFVYTPIYQRYVSRDINYNPYFRHNSNPFN